MGKENKVSLVIFTLFLVYGIQGYFAAKAFIIPFFLNKLFYLLAAVIFLGLWLFNKKEKNSILPPILLVVISLAWIFGDPYSTEFLAYSFNAYEGFMIFENFYLILTSLIVFILCLFYFAWNIYRLQKTGIGKTFVIILFGLSISAFVASDPIWQKILLPIVAVLLAYSISKNTSRTSEIFSAWINLVALLEVLTLLIPASSF